MGPIDRAMTVFIILVFVLSFTGAIIAFVRQ